MLGCTKHEFLQKKHEFEKNRDFKKAWFWKTREFLKWRHVWENRMNLEKPYF